MPSKFEMIGQLFVLAFRDSIRILRHQWPNLLVLLAAALLMLVPVGLLAPFVKTQLARILVLAELEVGYLWLIAPYLVALYRFIATDERIPAESIRGTDAVAQFFAWGATLIFIAIIPSVVYHLLSPSGPVYYVGERPPVNQPRLLATLLALLATGILQLRLITLLPTSAFGGRGSMSGSIAETKGNFWFILGALTLPISAITLVSMLLNKIVTGLIGAQFGTVPSLLIGLGTVALYALTGMSLTVRLYQHLGQRS
jgi:hypothetical protein